MTRKTDNIFYIYQYRNKTNGKVYIGKTNNISRRKNRHRRNAFIDKLDSPFYRSLRKNTENGFEFSVLQAVNDEELAFQLEKQYISFAKSTDKNFGYNLTGGGEGSSGLKHNANQIKSNKSKFGANNGNSKLDDQKAVEIYSGYKSGIPMSQLISQYGVSQITIERLLSGNSWKHLNLDISALKGIKKENSKQLKNLFNAKLSVAQAFEICDIYVKGSISCEELSDLYKVSASSINNVLTGKTFHHNDVDYNLIRLKRKQNKIKIAIQNSPFNKDNDE